MIIINKPKAAEDFHRKFINGGSFLPNSRSFTMSSERENIIRLDILESAWMMGEITLLDVAAPDGQAIDIGNSSLHTGRVSGGRFRKHMAVNGTEFTLTETDSSASITWAEMSALASIGHHGLFEEKMGEFFAQAYALDMLRIGFNGRAIAETTDPEANKKGEDVNIGWHALASDFSGGKQVISKPLKIGESGDWKNIDALANHLITEIIAEPYREDPRLVVLVGAELAANQRLKLFNAADRPADVNAAQMATSSVAGRFAFIPPFMPGRRLAVTTLKNLQIYTQENTRYFRAEFDEDRKEYTHAYLRNEGYALGNPELYAAVDESAVSFV
ncbi:P2 family phage major capsid protein [Salmonella enterica subsp. enterica]|nr:major capsid protein [Salmonella enterica]EBS1320338.1 major capsid protein [Salmonella enterica subsp. enterica serovar Pomona]EDI3120914.1 major capsid protein [Salmonella enterica subsp. enterica serovar Newport]EDV4373091.1 P2 family phage major capsid protein [Salmonella enterica subsp. enterica]EAZ1810576.1 P2 family phage major capsid protein [Salmonella enterica]